MADGRGEYREAIDFVTDTMASHAEKFHSLASEISELILRFEGVTTQLESMEKQLLRVRKTTEEVTGVLNARGSEVNNIANTTNTEINALSGTTRLAEQLLAGTGNQGAQDGLAHAHQAMSTAELARQGTETVSEGIVQTMDLTHMAMEQLIDRVGMQILAAKEKIAETAIATGVSATNLDTTSRQADLAAQDWRGYSNTL